MSAARYRVDKRGLIVDAVVVHTLVFSLLLAPLFAAQPSPEGEPDVPPPSVGGGGGVIGAPQNCPSMPGSDVAEGFAPMPPLTDDVQGSVRIAAPAHGSTTVPRNAIVRLEGFLNSFDQEPPTLRVRMRATASGTTVETTRTGSIVRPIGGLPPNAEIQVRIEPTSDHPCPECEVFTPISFRTGGGFDNVAPEVSDGRVDVFVSPPECVGDQNATFLSRLDLSTDDVHFVEVALRFGDEQAQSILGVRVDPHTLPALVNRFLTSRRVAPGVDVRAAITVFDAAGNASPPLNLFTVTQPTPISGRVQDAPHNSCTLERASRVVVHGPLLAGDDVTVLHPFETIPLALRAPDGQVVALGTRSETIVGGEIFELNASLPPGTYSVLARECAQCECPECARVFPQDIEIVSSLVREVPEAPEVLAVTEIGPRAAQAAGACVEVAAGLQVEIARPVSAQADAHRYHLAVRRGDAPAIVIGRYLLPADRGDDRQVLAATAADTLPELFAEQFDLEVVVVDPAGARNETVFAVEPGLRCGASGVPRSAFAGFFGVVLVVFAARRRGRPGSPSAMRC